MAYDPWAPQYGMEAFAGDPNAPDDSNPAAYAHLNQLALQQMAQLEQLVQSGQIIKTVPQGLNKVPGENFMGMSKPVYSLAPGAGEEAAQLIAQYDEVNRLRRIYDPSKWTRGLREATIAAAAIAGAGALAPAAGGSGITTTAMGAEAPAFIGASGAGAVPIGAEAATAAIPGVGAIEGGMSTLGPGVGTEAAFGTTAGLSGADMLGLGKLGLGVAGLVDASNAGGDIPSTQEQLDLARGVRDLNLVDQNTPFGSTGYTIDPVTGRVTQDTSLSRQSQGLFNQAGGNLSSSMSALRQPFNADAYGDIYGRVNYNQPVQFGVGADDFSADRLRVEQALLDRYTPRYEEQRALQEQQLMDRLANQGATAGGEYYDRELDAFRQASGDQYRDILTQAILGGGQEQSRLFGMDLSQGQFANQAQQQGYNQAYGAADFANDAQQQAFTQGLQGRQQTGSEAALFGNLYGDIGGSAPSGYAPGQVATPNLMSQYNAQTNADMRRNQAYADILGAGADAYTAWKD